MANQAASVNEAGNGITRREFLYYIWGASIVLLTAQSVGLLIWFLIPRIREGEFGGKFFVAIDQLPKENAPPGDYPDGRFWLANLNTDAPNELMYQAQDEDPSLGVVAIYKVCTHLGCIYSWTPANSRFECPCHGSKYRLDGRRIESPAPRTLDRFKVQAVAEDKVTVLAESEVNPSVNMWAPLQLPAETAFIGIDTGDRMLGPSMELLCSFTGSCP